MISRVRWALLVLFILDLQNPYLVLMDELVSRGKAYADAIGFDAISTYAFGNSGTPQVNIAGFYEIIIFLFRWCSIQWSNSTNSTVSHIWFWQVLIVDRF